MPDSFCIIKGDGNADTYSFVLDNVHLSMDRLVLCVLCIGIVVIIVLY